jgi:hypothetical protein
MNMKIVYAIAIGIILLLVLLYFFRLPPSEQALVISRVELTPKNSFFATTFVSTASSLNFTFNITTGTCVPLTYYNVYLNGQNVKSNVLCPTTGRLSLTTNITLSSNQTAELLVSGLGITSGGQLFVNYQYEILYKQKVNGTTQPQSISTWMTIGYFADYQGITTDTCSVSGNILSSSPVESGDTLTYECATQLGITSASALYGRNITLSYVEYNNANYVPQNVKAVIKVTQYNTNQYIGQTTVTIPTEYLSPYNSIVSNAYCYSLSNLPHEELSLDIQVNYTVNNYPYNFQINGLYFNNTYPQPSMANLNCQPLTIG